LVLTSEVVGQTGFPRKKNQGPETGMGQWTSLQGSSENLGEGKRKNTQHLLEEEQTRVTGDELLLRGARVSKSGWLEEQQERPMASNWPGNIIGGRDAQRMASSKTIGGIQGTSYQHALNYIEELIGGGSIATAWVLSSFTRG